MENIHIVARFKIHAGQLDKFKKGVGDCIAATKNESGALLYDWFINENDMTCTVIETYKDSNAVLAHVGNVNEPLSKLMEISDFVVEVFGNASVELQNALKEMNVTPVPFFGGL
jgi:quinol monooxygenase YgiN